MIVQKVFKGLFMLLYLTSPKTYIRGGYCRHPSRSVHEYQGVCFDISYYFPENENDSKLTQLKCCGSQETGFIITFSTLENFVIYTLCNYAAALRVVFIEVFRYNYVIVNKYMHEISNFTLSQLNEPRPCENRCDVLYKGIEDRLVAGTLINLLSLECIIFIIDEELIQSWK